MAIRTTQHSCIEFLRRCLEKRKNGVRFTYRRLIWCAVDDARDGPRRSVGCMPVVHMHADDVPDSDRDTLLVTLDAEAAEEAS